MPGDTLLRDVLAYLAANRLPEYNVVWTALTVLGLTDGTVADFRQACKAPIRGCFLNRKYRLQRDLILCEIAEYRHRSGVYTHVAFVCGEPFAEL